MENEQKKDKTGIYTAIIAGVVTLSTAVIANVDKITGKLTTEPTKTEMVADTTSFNYNLEKVIKDCPNDFSNLIGNIESEEETQKNYFSKVNFTEGTSSVCFEEGENPTYMVLVYNGTDQKEAEKKKLELYKKISEFYKTTPKIEDEKNNDGSVGRSTIFEKGNTQSGLVEYANADGSFNIMLLITKK